MTASRLRVALCCDCGPDASPQHLHRTLALAEELVLRDADVLVVCDAESQPWARAQLDARRMEWVAPPDGPDGYVDLLGRREADAVVLDSRALPAEVYQAIRGSGRPTAAVVDGDAREEAARAEADLLVDPGIGAEENRLPRSAGTTALQGLGYALLRNDVLANRPIGPPRHQQVEEPTVVGLFESADAATAGPCVAEVLADTGRAFRATFVSTDAFARDRIAAVRTDARQRIDVAEPTWRLHERLARADVVLSSAGPATPELLCLGAAAGLVLADEQHAEDYRRLMVTRAVVGLGSVPNLLEDRGRGVEKAVRLLSDARERSRLAESAWRMVDGLGRARAVDALLALC